MKPKNKLEELQEILEKDQEILGSLPLLYQEAIRLLQEKKGCGHREGVSPPPSLLKDD